MPAVPVMARSPLTSGGRHERARRAVNVIIFGATGMIGSGVLLECLEDPRVRSVLAPVRTPSGIQHEKLRELVRTEHGRVMWARVKGRPENRLLAMPLNAYMFRAGYVQPMKGVRSKTGLYQAFYTLTRPLYPLLRRIAPDQITPSDAVGRAMIEVAANGYRERILRPADINALARLG